MAKTIYTHRAETVANAVLHYTDLTNRLKNEGKTSANINKTFKVYVYYVKSFGDDFIKAITAKELGHAYFSHIDKESGMAVYHNFTL